MRYVVVGYGNIGRRRARLLGARCVATVDPVAPDAARRGMDDVPPSSYDAVVLAVPNAAKLDYLRRFLAAGKPVLVEKPVLFAGRAEADQLQRSARTGAVWYTSYNHRFEPLIARLKHMLDEGAVGKLDRVRMLYGNGTVRDWVGGWREAGGGVLEDLGCHLLDLCGFLLGHEHEAYRLWELRSVESATWDHALFASADRRVVCEVGNVFWKNCFQIDVFGSAGSAARGRARQVGRGHAHAPDPGAPERPAARGERGRAGGRLHVGGRSGRVRAPRRGRRELARERLAHLRGAVRSAGAGSGARRARAGRMTAAIGVVGLSHLGTVVSAGLASLGLPVTAVDRADRVADFAPGRLPFPEPGLAELLAGPRPTFTADYAALAGASLVILAVDTMTDDRNRSDVSVLEAHVEGLLPWLRRDAVVVLMSQVPVGYTRALAARVRAHRPELAARVYYWVETLVIGDAVARYLRPERIILGGVAGQPEPALDALLERFGCPVHRMDWESAELCKAAINLYLATSVTFANTLADLCEATGASMRAIIPALRADRRIGPAAYIRPGLGLAGGNLERDLVHLKELAERTGVRADLSTSSWSGARPATAGCSPRSSGGSSRRRHGRGWPSGASPTRRTRTPRRTRSAFGWRPICAPGRSWSRMIRG